MLLYDYYYFSLIFLLFLSWLWTQIQLFLMFFSSSFSFFENKTRVFPCIIYIELFCVLSLLKLRQELKILERPYDEIIRIIFMFFIILTFLQYIVWNAQSLISERDSKYYKVYKVCMLSLIYAFCCFRMAYIMSSSLCLRQQQNYTKKDFLSELLMQNVQKICLA